ncbi:MAG TPA: PIG-L deacetylase family protein [Rhodothermales bacterium]|nr:PIG-L deacetylase family protein [Rhodothermales bacterium]
MTRRRVQVLCAHPDDELACAGTVAKHVAAGDRVEVRVFTDGVGARFKVSGARREEAALARWREAVAANRAMGAASIGYTDRFRDNEMDFGPLLEVVRVAHDHIREFGADTIYTHTPTCLNQDHVAVARAVLIATRPTPGQTVRAVYGFEVPSSTEWAFGSEGFKPNVFVDITATLDKKLEALRCYQSELRDYPHPRSERAVKARAEYWGQVAGVEYAEAFVLLREVR